MRRIQVVRTYLALDDPSQFRAKEFPAATNVALRRHDPCPVPLYRRLYKQVGEPWFWHDRLEWSDQELAHHLAKPGVGVWELTSSEAASAGYFELQRHDDGSVEIAYFGLVPAFIGQGLGAWMLERAVQESWAMGATRVWVHTCTLDSERALPNYRNRGFVPFKMERLEVDIEGTEVISERLLHD